MLPLMRAVFLAAATLLGLSVAGNAQGTLPITLQQQFSFSGCSTTGQACGTPLIGGLLYFYQVGTVATPQNSFQDTALTIPNPWPLILDANGRVPAFYLANGSVHVRLTDAGGVVQFDYPNMLVIGPSAGGGGGSGVDPSTIASTGDIKFRATGETLVGWVKLNGLTIGSAVSGATGRANADTQSAFIYLWTNCPDTHCPVAGGRGGTALADFTANKQIAVFDCRGRICGVGLDDMGAAAAGRLLASNVTSGGGDTVTTPSATGGEANHTLTVAEIPAHAHTIVDPGHTHPPDTAVNFMTSGGGAGQGGAGAGIRLAGLTGSSVTGITINNSGGGGAHNNMSPFMLGTWHLKL